MRILVLILASFVSGGLVLGDAAPKILIVPMKTGAAAAPSLAIGNYLAQELDQDGRLTPVVWSLTDPTFRQSASSGLLGSVPDFPSKAKAEVGAHGLGAVYVLFYSSETRGKGIEARADLFEGKKEIWHNVQNLGSHEEGSLNHEDSNRSIAHTWILLLVNSQLKTLKPRPKTTTPTPLAGQEPVQVVTTTLPPPDSASTALESAQELSKAGKIEQAIAVVRDSIDADPFNPKLRLFVVGLYEKEKNWLAAADAAKRASDVIPNNVELRTASLRDLLAAGKTQDVREQLNQIVARDPSSESSLALQSQTYLIIGEYPKASAALDTLVKKAPKPEYFYLRALCRATLGGADGVNSDIQEYLKAPAVGESADESCKESERILQSATEKDIALALNCFQQAGIHPNSRQVADQLDQLIRAATSRSEFLQQVAPAALVHDSYGQLLMAQKLLLVSFVSMQDVVKTSSDDSAVDARINLGEAIKSLKASKQKLAAELGDSEVAEPVVGNP